MSRTPVAIIGSGNIGTDLAIKIARLSDVLELRAVAGVDPLSEGLQRAWDLGATITSEGVTGLTNLAAFEGVKIVFDATSASQHPIHDALLRARGCRLIDLTPAAIGPFVVPPVNGDAHVDADNINMVTCGGQATIPIVAAVARVADVRYAEIVASIASKSAGPGTRANIDEFTETTSRALERVGGAERGKAIIILNPAEPPLVMRDTVYCLTDDADAAAIEASVERMVAAVQAYVPGYRLKQRVQFETVRSNHIHSIPGLDGVTGGLKTSVFLEVEGAGHFLPPYAGNLDIMTSAALRVGEQMAGRLHNGGAP
jgi:acetaldehyde dehydrogenase